MDFCGIAFAAPACVPKKKQEIKAFTLSKTDDISLHCPWKWTPGSVISFDFFCFFIAACKEYSEKLTPRFNIVFFSFSFFVRVEMMFDGNDKGWGRGKRDWTCGKRWWMDRCMYEAKAGKRQRKSKKSGELNPI